MRTTLSGPRALLVVACAVALFSVMAVANLERIATHEVIPEISAAAGLALGRAWAEAKTEAQLEDLVVTGRTIGLRVAASAALSILYFDKTGEELMAILAGDAHPMIRAAAIAPAQMHLVRLRGRTAAVRRAELEGLARTGATPELRLAAARAFYIVILATIPARLDALRAEADGDTELAIAAGEVLGGFYLFHPALRKTKPEIVAQAIGAGSAGLRAAGAAALTALLIQSDETIASLQRTMVAIAFTGSVEYRNAYKAALAQRFGR